MTTTEKNGRLYSDATVYLFIKRQRIFIKEYDLEFFMSNTNTLKEDKTSEIPKNVLYPLCCQKQGDKMLVHTLPQEGDGIENGIM